MLNRRQTLAGFASLAALPRLADAAPAAQAPLRIIYIYQPNGVVGEQWHHPVNAGALGQLPPSLAPLQQLKSKITVIRGLEQKTAFGGPDGAGDHAREVGCFLTGVRIDKKGLRAGISVDQRLAALPSMRASIPSLELGLEAGRPAGECDSGYACAYSNNLSWSAPTRPAGKDCDPRSVFTRLFGDPKRLANDAELVRQAADLEALAPLVTKQARGQAGSDSLDAYLASLEECRREARLGSSGKSRMSSRVPIPEGIPVDPREHLRQLYRLLAEALRLDRTRVATLMLGNGGSDRVHHWLGHSEGHHTISHHQRDATKLRQLAQIDRWHQEEFALFLQLLAATPEGSGSVLDHCAIVFASCINDGDRHDHGELPLILAGGAGGRLQPGRCISRPGQSVNSLHSLFLSWAGEPKPLHGDARNLLDLA